MWGPSRAAALDHLGTRAEDVQGSRAVPTDREHGEKSRKSCAHPLTRFAGRITARHGARRPLRLSESDLACEDAAAPRWAALRAPFHRRRGRGKIGYFQFHVILMSMSESPSPVLWSTVSALPDYLLLSQTRQLARHEQALQILVLDHLREIEMRGLHLTRGYGSLFDYAITEPIYKYCNGLLVVPISRYCFRNPSVISDRSLIRFGLAPGRARRWPS